MLAFALTIFTGAFLLFQVQPLIGKYILPWFGGGPAVWTTCMLFFQLVLLAGYAYAHLNIRLFKPSTGAIVHLVLLAAAVAVLPIIPNAAWRPQDAADPTLRILLLLGVTLGLPYLVLSSTSPLLQAWVGRINPGKTPYRLYSLSNVGSLLALVSYPFLIEPYLARNVQAWAWSTGMIVYVALCAACTLLARRARGLSDSPAEPRGEEGLLLAQSATTAGGSSAATPGGTQAQLADGDEQSTPPPLPAALVEATLAVRLLWLALPACAVVLLLAVTNALCQEAGAVPFLWVVPLGIYLLTFIICFDHERWYHRGVFLLLSVAAVAGLACFMALDSLRLSYALLKVFRVFHMHLTSGRIALAIFAVYLGTLFITCMTCHGELYRLKPRIKHLTSYYLMIAAGGALGGILVALVAPRVFTGYYELQIGLLGCLVLAALAVMRDHAAETYHWVWVITAAVAAVVFVVYFGGCIGTMWALLLAAPAILVVVAALREYSWINYRVMLACLTLLIVPILGHLLWLAANLNQGRVVAARRNFYGTLTVAQEHGDDPRYDMYAMFHGQTNHGKQLLAPDLQRTPTTYYGKESGVGLAMQALTQKHRRIGLIGLGAGTLAVYGRPDDLMKFYEINPQTLELAQKYFTFLKNCSAKLEFVLGDARLTLEREAPQQYDLLVVDAFSGDSVPTHLLTKEAFGIYLKHLKAGGVIAIHITNRYYDLQPIVWRLAQEAKLHSVYIRYVPEHAFIDGPSSWMLLSRDSAIFADAAIKKAGTNQSFPDAPLWTDEKSSLLGALWH